MDALTVTVAEKSTNARSIIIRAIRAFFRVACRRAPALAAAVAEWIWFAPPRAPRSPRGSAVLATGRRLDVRWRGRRIAVWQWGAGPAVYLVHGWGGNAGQMTGFVEGLVAAGLRPVAFDAPAHGASDPGFAGWRQTHFFESAEVLRTVIAAAGPAHGIIAHSGGAASTAVALRDGLHAQRLVLLSAFAHPVLYTDRFAEALDISPAVIAAMRRRAERRLGFDWQELSVPALTARAAVPPALVIHDREDVETAATESEAIAAAWPRARLLLTQGLGHRRLLRDPAVLAQVTAFLLEPAAARVDRAEAPVVRAAGRAAAPAAQVLCAAALLLALPAGDATANVSAEEAARLKAELTPVGAERAGNGDGTIPSWDGGLVAPPASYTGDWYVDPFPDDRPLYTVTAQNLEQHRKRLSVGQLAMFAKHPGTYRLNVYETRRTAAYPQAYYDATFRNATTAELGGNGEALLNAVIGVPFPIPRSGHEPIWNHKTRYRGRWERRWNNQFAVTQSGSYSQVKIREDISYTYSHPGATPERLQNVMLYFLQVVTAPPRLTGTITLVHETMDQVAEPRRAWQYNPGQRRLRRAPNVGYDNPGTAADGLRTNDQTDTFNGAMDRYTWKLLGKREMLVPYNSYKLHDRRYKYADLVQRAHLNPDLARYELHRVWVVDAVTKPGTTHIYKRRTFYLDEDSWQIVLVDVYDRRDALWRWQEAHTINYYDKPLLHPIGETIYDLQSNRYLAQAFNNEDPEYQEKPFEAAHFAPANVSKQVLK